MKEFEINISLVPTIPLYISVIVISMIVFNSIYTSVSGIIPWEYENRDDVEWKNAFGEFPQCIHVFQTAHLYVPIDVN